MSANDTRNNWVRFYVACTTNVTLLSAKNVVMKVVAMSANYHTENAKIAKQ